jgi:hypothetical protein
MWRGPFLSEPFFHRLKKVFKRFLAVYEFAAICLPDARAKIVL